MILKGSTTNFAISASNYYYVAGVLTNGVPTTSVCGTNFYDFVYTDIQAYRTAVVYGLIQPCLATQGTPLWWLGQHGFTNDFDLAEDNDTDMDGMPARNEYLAGTIPTNKNSVFRFVGQGSCDGTNYIQWIGGTTGPTNPYEIYYSTNLKSGNWTPTGIVDRVHGTNIWWLFVPANPDPVFFRVSATN